MTQVLGGAGLDAAKKRREAAEAAAIEHYSKKAKKVGISESREP